MKLLENLGAHDVEYSAFLRSISLQSADTRPKCGCTVGAPLDFGEDMNGLK